MFVTWLRCHGRILRMITLDMVTMAGWNRVGGVVKVKLRHFKARIGL